MGNDGGSIPKRRELVKEAARLPTASELKATALESLAHAWSACPLSSEPLDPAATVSDWRGRLYSYESVLRCLVPSSSASESRSQSVPEMQQAEFAKTGIRGLRDVVRLRFATRRDERGREFRACPVSMKELGAGTRAVYVVPCGHVFADVAIKETITTTATAGGEEQKEGADQKQCPECSEPFRERDIVPILSTDEAEIERLAKRIDELKALGLAHTLKKDKSGGKKKRKAGEAKEEGGASGEAKEEKRNGDKERNSSKNGISSRINNTMTASLTAKVLAEQEERNKRRKIADGYKRSEAVR